MNSERKYRFCFLDRIWFAAESWSRKVHNNLSGSSLFFFCWLWIVAIPVFIPLALHYLHCLIAVITLPIVCLIPSLLCKLRYTPERRKAIARHYGKLRHPGREVALIILVSILLTVASFTLMFHLGFIHRDALTINP